MRGAQIGLFGAAALNAFKGIAYISLQEPNSQAFIFIFIWASYLCSVVWRFKYYKLLLLSVAMHSSIKLYEPTLFDLRTYGSW